MNKTQGELLISEEDTKPSIMDVFCRRPVVAIVLSLVLVLVGIRAAIDLPVLQFPKIASASLQITTPYIGASADVVQGFIDEDFPLDAVVLDLYWFGKEIKGEMGNLDWDKDSFPTPLKIMVDFRKQGVKMILITETFILSTSS